MAILKSSGKASDFVASLNGIRGVRNYGPYGVFEVNNMSAQLNRTKAQLPLSTSMEAGKIDFPDRNHPCEQGMLLVYDEAVGIVRKARDLNENIMIHYSEMKFYDERREMLSDFALYAQEEVTGVILGQVQDKDRVTSANNIPGTIAPNTWIKKIDLDAMSLTPNTTFFYDETPFPRMLQPMRGDVFTTNLVVFNPTGDFANMDTMKEAIEAGRVWAQVAVDVAAATTAGGPWAAAQNVESTNGYYELTTTEPTAKVFFKAVKFYDLPDGQPGIRFEVWS